MHRLARLLHQAQSSDEPVAKETVVLGMESGDQRIVETNAVHKAPRQEARVLMLHILSINDNLAIGRGGLGSIEERKP